ncbi:hypothetical protein [Ulvibacterium marinum]|uniref:Conjugal transfer protein TraI n=1 Tax=Ulvibacterium marinum TaxID=2419782 RepID=A0A3B0CBZ7_9FLAO|nr:hypothetical protein [Ulvibacterium marinum]RKN83473.1 hypothetical protein D7Z94_06555 [Ulvibacterium marinum]
MKKIILIKIILFPLLAWGQIPVTDAATNASIGLVNSQLTNINIQLKAMNKNLARLINLLEKNNNLTSKSKEILKEELEAKKQAPAYVTKSTEVALTLDLKDKIVEAYQTSRNTVQNFEHLERNEIQDFLIYSTEAIVDTKNLFKQCNQILKTKSIIHPEERLKEVTSINTKLEAILDELIDYNNRLEQINSYRLARKTMVNLNKN